MRLSATAIYVSAVTVCFSIATFGTAWMTHLQWTAVEANDAAVAADAAEFMAASAAYSFVAAIRTASLRNARLAAIVNEIIIDATPQSCASNGGADGSGSFKTSVQRALVDAWRLAAGATTSLTAIAVQAGAEVDGATTAAAATKEFLLDAPTIRTCVSVVNTTASRNETTLFCYLLDSTLINPENSSSGSTLVFYVSEAPASFLPAAWAAESSPPLPIGNNTNTSNATLLWSSAPDVVIPASWIGSLAQTPLSSANASSFFSCEGSSPADVTVSTAVTRHVLLPEHCPSILVMWNRTSRSAVPLSQSAAVTNPYVVAEAVALLRRTSTVPLLVGEGVWIDDEDGGASSYLACAFCEPEAHLSAASVAHCCSVYVVTLLPCSSSNDELATAYATSLPASSGRRVALSNAQHQRPRGATFLRAMQQPTRSAIIGLWMLVLTVAALLVYVLRRVFVLPMTALERRITRAIDFTRLWDNNTSNSSSPQLQPAGAQTVSVTENGITRRTSDTDKGGEPVPYLPGGGGGEPGSSSGVTGLLGSAVDSFMASFSRVIGSRASSNGLLLPFSAANAAPELFGEVDDPDPMYDVLSDVTDSEADDSSGLDNDGENFDAGTGVDVDVGGDAARHIRGVGRRARSIADSEAAADGGSAASDGCGSWWWQRCWGSTAAAASAADRRRSSCTSGGNRRKYSVKGSKRRWGNDDKNSAAPSAANGNNNNNRTSRCNAVSSREVHSLHQQLRKVFRLANMISRYVPKEVVKDLMSANRRVASREMTQRVITLMFCDIASFTTFCEMVDPQDVVELLDLYFTQMTNILLQHGCTVDKYIGDAIMGFWGAPLEYHNQGFSACCAALHMQHMVHKLRPYFAKFHHDLRVRIGMHRGSAAVGNIGCSARIAYTALGDSVNTAARLEGLNKYFGTQVCVSQPVVDDVEYPYFAFRCLGSVRVKGKQEPLLVHELVGARAGATTIRRESNTAAAATGAHSTLFLDAAGDTGSENARTVMSYLSVTDKVAELSPESELSAAKKFRPITERNMALLARLDAAVGHYQRMEVALAVTCLDSVLKEQHRALHALHIDVPKLQQQLEAWRAVMQGALDPTTFDPCITMTEK